jgi:hypothetical protein
MFTAVSTLLPLVSPDLRSTLVLTCNSMEGLEPHIGLEDLIQQSIPCIMVQKSMFGFSRDIFPALVRFNRILQPSTGVHTWEFLFSKVPLPVLPADASVDDWNASMMHCFSQAIDVAHSAFPTTPDSKWSNAGPVVSVTEASTQFILKRAIPTPPSTSPWLIRKDAPLFVSVTLASLTPTVMTLHFWSPLDFVRIVTWLAPFVNASGSK